MSVTTTMPVAPARSYAQQMEALALANATRAARKDLKVAIAQQGPWRAVELLEEPTRDVLTMRVFDLLLAIPKVGRVKANRWLVRTRISPSKTLGGLTPRQRRELLDVMGF